MDVAKKAAAAAVSVEDLLRQAVQTAANANATDSVRLSGKPKEGEVSLFASAAGANKEAIERAIRGDGAPLRVTRTEGKTDYVELTRAGFEQVRGALPPERVASLAGTIAGGLGSAEQVEFLTELIGRTPDAAPELVEKLRAATAAETARIAAETAEAVRRTERRERVRRALDEARQLEDELRAARIDSLRKQLAAEGEVVPEPIRRPTPDSPPQPVRPPEPNRPLAVAVTPEEKEFRRDVAERLVSSWRDAASMGKDETRRFLETALDNVVALRRVGEEGDEVPFDGALHEAIPGVFTDHPVRVTRSGWALDEDADREYVIQKAQVAKP